jgi:hypothetical protein
MPLLSSKRSWTSYVPACWFHVLSKGFLDEMGPKPLVLIYGRRYKARLMAPYGIERQRRKQDGRSRHEGTSHCERSIIVNLSYRVKLRPKR